MAPIWRVKMGEQFQSLLTEPFLERILSFMEKARKQEVSNI